MNLEFAVGTKIEGSGLSVAVEENANRHGDTRLRITYTVTLSCVVYVPKGGGHNCGICASPAPLPDGELGLLYILRNHDGDRLCFAAEENIEERRDTYPVIGWRNVTVGDKEVLACAACCATLDTATLQVINGIKDRRG